MRFGSWFQSAYRGRPDPSASGCGISTLAESLARVADERTALAVLLRACALTQNIEVGGNRPLRGYHRAAEQCSFHGSILSRRSVGVDKSAITLKIPEQGALSAEVVW
jgi:hypothetical protein